MSKVQLSIDQLNKNLKLTDFEELKDEAKRQKEVKEKLEEHENSIKYPWRKKNE